MLFSQTFEQSVRYVSMQWVANLRPRTDGRTKSVRADGQTTTDGFFFHPVRINTNRAQVRPSAFFSNNDTFHYICHSWKCHFWTKMRITLCNNDIGFFPLMVICNCKKQYKQNYTQKLTKR